MRDDTRDPLLAAWRQLMRLGGQAGEVCAPEPAASEVEISAVLARMTTPVPALLVDLWRASRTWLWRDPRFDAVMFTPPGGTYPEYDADIEVEASFDTRVKALARSPRRLDFARTDYHAIQLDFDPGPGGKAGQVVIIDVEEGTIDLLADSFEAFLAEGLQHIKNHLLGGFPHATPVRPADAARIEAVVIPQIPTASGPAPEIPPIASARPSEVPSQTSTSPDASLLALDAWLAGQMPPDSKRFKPALTGKKIQQLLSKHAGARLPAALEPVYLTVNGQAQTREMLLPCPLRLCRGLELLPLDAVFYGITNDLGTVDLLRACGVEFPAVVGVLDQIWHPEWLCFARSSLDHAGMMGRLFLDTVAAPGGAPGQVVFDLQRYDTQGRLQSTHRQIVAPTLDAYFEQLVFAATNGKLRYQKGLGVVWV